MHHEPSTINPQYDVKVVGAGLSGFIAAAFLAKAGVRVLVCDQNTLAGGLFNSFWRDGYLFDGGIKAVENSAVIMPMLAQVGLMEKIKFQRNLIALIIHGHMQPINGFAAVEAYYQLLTELFPDEQTGLQRALKDTKIVYELLDRMKEGEDQ